VRSSLRSFSAKGFAHLPFVLDILRRGSSRAERAIFKAEAWNLLFRKFELLFTVLRVGTTGSQNARVE